MLNLSKTARFLISWASIERIPFPSREGVFTGLRYLSPEANKP